MGGKPKRFSTPRAMGTKTIVRMVLLWNTRPEYIIRKVRMTYSTQNGVSEVMPSESKAALTIVLGRSVALSPLPST